MVATPLRKRPSTTLLLALQPSPNANVTDFHANSPAPLSPQTSHHWETSLHHADNPPETVAAEGKKPTVDKSFDILLKKVEKYDEELVKGWRDDIDTLLVFAGLFSAVVTAFLIESYQKLEEDPADKTVVLLEQLVSFQRNASQALAADPIPPFQPDASTIRINCFWLLSLIFSLTSALFGLLCKQWVREFQRDTPTSTPAEALALRQLRRDSFEKWNVPAFLAALPILLEIALLFFFAGILDLLWGLHRIPFAISLVAVLLSAGLYSITTLLPTLTIPKDQKWNIRVGHFEQLSYQFICPYKSPQAWLFYRFVCKILHPLSKFWLSTGKFERRIWKPAPALRYHIESSASDWSAFDLRVVRQYDQHVKYGGDDLFSLQIYQLRAFEWAVTMFRDSPLMIPHLQNVLGTIPPSVAMSAVLGHWDVALWDDVSVSEVQLAVADPGEPAPQILPSDFLVYFPQHPTTAIPAPVICQSEGIKFLFEHHYLMTGKSDDAIPAALGQMGVQTAGFHFVAPLSVLGRLWAHQDAGFQKRGLALLHLYEESWKSCSGVENDGDDRHRKERTAFVSVLAKHINRTDHTSVLITSKRGRGFIRFIHNEIICQRLYAQSYWMSGHVIWFPLYQWQQAIERTREVGNLPPDYFAPLPPSWGFDHPTPVLPPLPPRRYSLETVPDVELDHDNEAPDSQLDGSLPSGWERLTTPEGRPYFFDHKIGTVTWEDPGQNIPMAPDSQLDGPLPSGWVERTTKDDRTYFFHFDTHTATWLDPRRCALPGGQAAESSGSGNPQASDSQLDGSLPSGWEQRNILGTPYFFDLNTCAVFWKDPRQFVPAHQVAESSGSGNPQASGSQPEWLFPFRWGQGTFLGTPYFFDLKTCTATWKDPRQIDPAVQVAESSGSGNPWISQDDSYTTLSCSPAVESDTDPDSGTLSEAGQRSSPVPAPDDAEVEASSSISSSNSRVDVHMPLPFNSYATNHPAQSLDPLAPFVPPTLRTDNLNCDTEVSSPQDDGETLDIQTINTSGNIENAENSSALERGHIVFAGGGGPSHLHSTHDVGNESIRRNVEGAGVDRTSDEEVTVLDSLVAPSTGDIDMENTNVVQSSAPGEEHTISQDAPPPLVDPGVNEQTNHSGARTEEQHTRSWIDTEHEENIHPENSSIVTGKGRGTSIVDLGHLSGKDKDYHSPLSGQTDTSCLDNPESTSRARDAAFGFSAHSGQDDEQAFGARSEQDAQSSDGSQRKDVYTTDRGQAAQAHPEVDYSEERHDDAELPHSDQDIDTITMKSSKVQSLASREERTVFHDPPSAPIDEQVAHTEEQVKQEHLHPK
ncbi:hypothetical protein VNI00_010810 [Paramarasmius palmivorus]|uniref:WW domain-containing protein n=1 Tax=Paramarasmius palmivorus TaxID=297713 RepID=A0AAW0CFG0_9AGAR